MELRINRVRIKRFRPVFVIFKQFLSHIFCALIAGTDDPVRFVPSVVDHPDLPSWLLFTQKDLLSDGFLYGTPLTTEDSTSIQVPL